MIKGNMTLVDDVSAFMSFFTIGKNRVFTFKNSPKGFYDILLKSKEKYCDKVALIDDEGNKYTYQKLLTLVNSLSSALHYKYKIKKQEQVCLMFHNNIEFCVSLLALSKLRAIAVILPSKYTQSEVVSLIEKTDANFILCDEEYKDWFNDISLRVVYSKCGDYGFSYLDKDCKDIEYLGEYNDKAIMMFTSGTTSKSKCVVLKNYNLLHAIISYSKIFNITEKDKTIIATPIYHITGITALFGLFLYSGGLIYLQKKFDTKKFLEATQKNEITFIHASPTIFALLLEARENYNNIKTLRMLACGSSNMPPQNIKRLKEWIPTAEFRTVYGLTETSSPATIFPRDAATSRYIGSSGVPIFGVEIKIADDDGKELLNDEVGEVLIKGAVVLEEYYKLKTDSFTDDGFFKTGDLGYINKEGYLYVVDRKKDIINRGGEKILSFDIENELHNIKGIIEAVVVGISDNIYGEIPVALVKLESDVTLTFDDIYKILKKRLAKYQIPVKIIFTESIPKTPNGKTDKKSIKQLFI